MKPNLQHAIERVERPGGSHEGVGRKKRLRMCDFFSSMDYVSIEFISLLNAHCLQD